MVKEWYSHDLTEEEASELHRFTATISHPTYGLDYMSRLALQFHLEYDNGTMCDPELINSRDIRALFRQTGTNETSQLEGKTIEIISSGMEFRGLVFTVEDD